MASSRGLWLRFLPAALAAAGITLALVVNSNHDSHPILTYVFGAIVALAFVVGGLIAWTRRPTNRTGRLMVAVGFVWFTGALAEANNPLLCTVGRALAALPYAIFAHLLVSYPTGWLRTARERAIVVATYALAGFGPLMTLLVERSTPRADLPRNVFVVSRNHALGRAVELSLDAMGVLLALAIGAVLVQRWRSAGGAGRRVLAPVYAAGTLTLAILAAGFVADAISDQTDTVSFAATVVFLTVPVFFMVGLLRTRLGAATVSASLLAEVPDLPTPAEAEQGLRRALGDPTLQLLHYRAETRSFQDVDGNALELPSPESGRAVSVLEYESSAAPLAALIYDPVLREEPEILDSILRTARVAIARDRLQWELRARLDELSEERDFMSAVLDTAPTLVCVFDREGRILRINRECEQVTGFTREELRGRRITEMLVPAEEVAGADTALAGVFEGRATENENHWLTKDGNRRLILWRNTFLPGEDGSPSLGIGAGIDITEQRSTEREREALQRELEARLAQIEREQQFTRTVVNTAPSFFVVLDLEGRIVRFNLMLEQASGILDSDELRGQPFWDVFGAPEEAQEMRGRLLAAAAVARSPEYENDWVDSTGERRLIAWSTAQLSDEHGERRLLLTGIDVSARRAAEDELRAGEKRLRALVDAMPDLMFRISQDGTYLDYNAQNESDLLDPEVIGKNVYDRLPQDLADQILAAARRTPEDPLQTIEYELEFGDGERRHYEGRIAASGPDEFLLIVREITDRKRYEQELRKSRARIVEAGDAERRRLERNLHDGAQQRLVSISLALRLVQAKMERTTDEAAEILSNASNELALALQELRELARGIHPAILSERGLDAALEALAARAPLPVDLTRPEERLPPPVEAAAYYVVAEALTNVAKYADASSVSIKVQRMNGKAIVEVADDGVGGADAATGSGLRGLADRVEALDGRLFVTSAPGAGTQIRAEIPCE
jgi:PAS domain S-box-containing protein